MTQSDQAARCAALSWHQRTPSDCPGPQGGDGHRRRLSKRQSQNGSGQTSRFRRHHADPNYSSGFPEERRCIGSKAQSTVKPSLHFVNWSFFLFCGAHWRRRFFIRDSLVDRTCSVWLLLCNTMLLSSPKEEVSTLAYFKIVTKRKLSRGVYKSRFFSQIYLVRPRHRCCFDTKFFRENDGS